MTPSAAHVKRSSASLGPTAKNREDGRSEPKGSSFLSEIDIVQTFNYRPVDVESYGPEAERYPPDSSARVLNENNLEQSKENELLEQQTDGSKLSSIHKGTLELEPDTPAFITTRELITQNLTRGEPAVEHTKNKKSFTFCFEKEVAI